jgi:uncharacterized protein
VVRRVAVSDASPIIAYASIGQLDLLERLLSHLLAPPRVVQEIRPSVGSAPPWIIETHLQRRPTLLDAWALDAGEYEAIGLALELNARVILDDRPARLVAKHMGLEVTGSIGLALLAKEANLIPRVRPVIDDLVASGLYVRPSLIADALHLAGEAE